MPFSVNKEFLGYLLVLVCGFIDAFLIAHPSLIIRVGYHFPELEFLTRLSTSVFLVLALLSLFYISSGMILHGAAVKKWKLSGAFLKIRIFCTIALLFLFGVFLLFAFSRYSLLNWPFKTGLYLFGLLLLGISLLRLRKLRQIGKWHREMEE